MIVVLPTYAQKLLPVGSNDEAARPAYEAEIISNRTAWNKTFSLETSFTVPSRQLWGYKVGCSLEFFVDAVSDAWRNTTITYAFLCNGKEVRTIVEHVDGTGLRFGGSYPEKSIGSETLRYGNNTLVVNAVITSESAVASASSFLLRLDRIIVSGVIRDRDGDGDGIWDMIDPLSAINNYHVIPVAAVLSLPIFAVMERRFKSVRR